MISTASEYVCRLTTYAPLRSGGPNFPDNLSASGQCVGMMHLKRDVRSSRKRANPSRSKSWLTSMKGWSSFCRSQIKRSLSFWSGGTSGAMVLMTRRHCTCSVRRCGSLSITRPPKRRCT
eukprot:767828-Prymnesium_polylepis.2